MEFFVVTIEMFSKFKSSFSERKFRSFFGINIHVAFYLYLHNCMFNNELNAEMLLVTLYYLKNYPTIDVGSILFGLDTKTFSKYILMVVDQMNNSLNTIEMEKEKLIGKPFGAIVDCTELPINRPEDNVIQKLFYSGKAKRHTIKYEVATNFEGKIVWVAGPYAGSFHDLTVARTSGIIENLNIGKILADKAYIGEEAFLTPFRSPQSEYEELWNSNISKLRISVENAFSRVKKFKILKDKFRGDLKSHYKFFKLICKIINIEFVENPIF